MENEVCCVRGCHSFAQRVVYNTCRTPPKAMSMCERHAKYHEYGDTMYLKDSTDSYDADNS